MSFVKSFGTCDPVSNGRIWLIRFDVKPLGVGGSSDSFGRSVSNFFSPFDDGGVTPEVSVCRCDVTNALMVTLVIVMIAEGASLVFQIAWQIISSPAECCFSGFGINA